MDTNLRDLQKHLTDIPAHAASALIVIQTDHVQFSVFSDCNRKDSVAGTGDRKLVEVTTKNRTGYLTDGWILEDMLATLADKNTTSVYYFDVDDFVTTS